jgi:hypothetical protein
MYLEKIEDQLCDIEMFALNRRYYGESFLGRKMREIFVVIVNYRTSHFQKKGDYSLRKIAQTVAGFKIGRETSLLSDVPDRHCNRNALFHATPFWLGQRDDAAEKSRDVARFRVRGGC